MSKPLTATQIKKAMEKFGVKVEYLDGWEKRGRPASKGPFNDVHGVIIHHSGGPVTNASSYSKFLFINGRSDLPAPLCHAEGRGNGTIVIGAIGRANHAGLGSNKSLAAVFAETTKYFNELTTKEQNNLKGGELKPLAKDNNQDGNRSFYGIEIDYGGSTSHMTAAQYKSAVNWAAALCDAHGWTGRSVIGHREWTYTKPDPAGINMCKFREDVQRRIDEVNKKTPAKPVSKPETPNTICSV